MKLAKLKLIFLTLFTFCFLTLSGGKLSLAMAEDAFESGGRDGGGGKGVVCRNPDGSIKSVELLDLWEAREIYQRTIPISGRPIAEQVANAIQALKYSIYYPGTVADSSGAIFPTSNFFAQSLQKVADQFLNNAPFVIRKHRTTLTDVPDSFESARPSDCKVEQLVNFMDTPTDPIILVNQDLVDQMDFINQAALLVHEALYTHLRANYREVNSIRVRRAVGFVFAGNAFTSLETVVGTSYLECNSQNESKAHSTSSIIFYTETGGTARVISTLSFGQPSMGFQSMATSSYLNSTPDLTELCQGADGKAYSEYVGTGPVDFQQSTPVLYVCKDKQLSIFVMQDRAQPIPGGIELPPNSQKLTCRKVTR